MFLAIGRQTKAAKTVLVKQVLSTIWLFKLEYRAINARHSGCTCLSQLDN